MLNQKRMFAVFAAVIWALTSPTVTTTATEVSTIEIGVPYAEDDPGRERLSGEVSWLEGDVLLEEQEWLNQELIAEGAMLAAKGRAISGYSPFMGNTPYFHSDVFVDRNIVHGIDVSKYQKEINWQKVKESGVEYAIIRVGFRGYGKTGGIGADTYFKQNIEGALEAGIKVGVYMFSQATTVEEAIEEAKYTLDKIHGYDITMPVVMDYEYAHVNGKEGGRLYDANLSKEQATKICLAFCETVEAAGYEPMLYANSTMLKNKLNASDISNRYKVWLANYTSMTSYEGKYDFWQYSSKGKVDGIEGNVDCNFWYEEVVPEVNVPELTGFTVGGRTDSRIRLNWQKAEGVTGYRIYRYDETEKKYKKVKTITTAEATTWVDTKLEPGKSYQYVIKGYVKNETGTYWGVKTTPIKGKTRTGKVEGFALTVARKDKVRLSWQQTKGADGYRIYRYNDNTGNYERIRTLGAGNETTWVNSNLKNNTEYQYKIRAYIETENGTRYAGDYSEVVTAKTKK